MTVGKYPKSDGEIFWARDANMAYYQGALANTMNYGSQTVTTSATLVVNSNVNRRGFLLRNLGAETIYVGGSTVTGSTGASLLPNKCVYLKGGGATQAVYAITSSSTSDVRYLEAYDA